VDRQSKDLWFRRQLDFSVFHIYKESSEEEQGVMETESVDEEPGPQDDEQINAGLPADVRLQQIDQQTEPYHLSDTEHLSSVEKETNHASGDFNPDIGCIKTQPCDPLSSEAETVQHELETGRNQSYSYPGFHGVGKIKSAQEIKSEPADQLSSHTTPDEVASSVPILDSYESEGGGTESTPPPGPVPVNLIPAARNKGLLKIEVDDPLHTVSCEAMNVEDVDESPYDFEVTKAENDVSRQL
jgi:hypothetical protein